MGGVETYTLHLAHALQQLNHEVHLLTGQPAARRTLAVELHHDTFEDLPVTRLVYDYEQRSSADRASYNDPLITAEIKEVLQKLQPDLIHATSLSLLMAGLIEAAAGLNLPLIYTATDFVLTCRRGTYLKRSGVLCTAPEEMALCAACVGPQTPLERLLAGLWQLAPNRLAQPLLPVAEAMVGKKADFVNAEASMQRRFAYIPHWRQKIERIIAPSTHMRNMFILNGFPPEKIITSPYGVQPPKPGFSRTPAARLRFGFIGRVTAIKGVHLLLEAFKGLRAEQAELTIYGQADVKSDRYLQALQHQAAAAPNIKFAGFVENDNISEIYGQIDVLVVPSIWPENSPITILEALAHGIPIIASSVPGITDLVQHEVNGLIFANQEAQDLARQMSRCLESPELVARLAGRCKMVKSLAEDVRALTGLYSEVIAAKSG